MLPAAIRNKRILISPLNWGMGHVARCIPLIDILLKNGNMVFIACDHSQQVIFGHYFEEVKWIDHQGYPFDFSKGGSFRLNLLKQLPSLVQRWKKERDEVEQYCAEFAIDIIISDHRYGFRSEKIHSIFLTHQIQLPLYWYERLLQRLHFRWIGRFNEVWIPDDEQLNFAGKLSKGAEKLNATYIGTLSRFQIYQQRDRDKSGVVVVASGPVAYARQFVIEQAALIVSGNVTFIVPEELKDLSFHISSTVVFSNNWRKCDERIMSAEKIISRSGYSTLMDLVELKVPFSITPTPGQSEQIYLFNHWRSRLKE